MRERHACLSKRHLCPRRRPGTPQNDTRGVLWGWEAALGADERQACRFASPVNDARVVQVEGCGARPSSVSWAAAGFGFALAGALLGLGGLSLAMIAVGVGLICDRRSAARAWADAVLGDIETTTEAHACTRGKRR